MVPSPDDSSESLGRSATRAESTTNDDSSTGSLGDAETEFDIGTDQLPELESLGDQPTFGDLISSVGDLDNLRGDFDAKRHQVVDLTVRYDVQKTLGRGGMGEVVLAQDRQLNRLVAIKRLTKEQDSNRRAFQRFLTEAQSVATLNHFNIVQIYDYGLAVDGPFLVMEYVEGGSLAELLSDGPLQHGMAVEVIDQLCQALTAIHAHGVIHRDIKPANVLMTVDGIPKLADFGLAQQKTVDGAQTQAGTVLGTLDYMPPEQREDATRSDARSDLWSLAATFYQILTGEIPRVIRPDRLPIEFSPVLFKALEQDPKDRYASVDLFRRAIHKAETSRPRKTSDGITIGQCSSCGHMSAGDPQFCEACGISLLVPCFSCGVEIKPWTKFCPGCGKNITSLLFQRTRELQDEQKRVLTLRREYRYTEALKHLGRIEKENHPRFAAFQKWAKDQGRVLRNERLGLDEQLAAARTATESALLNHEYAEAVRLIGSLPGVILSQSDKACLADAQRKGERSRFLLKAIRKNVSERNENGLLPLLDEYVALKPNDDRLKPLHKKLGLRQERRHLFELGSKIREAVVSKKYSGVLPLVEGFLELRPSDERMQAFARKLRKRESLRFKNTVAKRIRLAFWGSIAIVSITAVWAMVALRGDDVRDKMQSVRDRIVNLAFDEMPQDQEALLGGEPVELLPQDKPVAGPGISTESGIPSRRRSHPMESPASVSKKIIEPLITLDGHNGIVHDVDFSPDGKSVVSGGGDKMLKIWDPQTGQETLSFFAHNRWVTSVNFSPDGRRIASGAGDGTIKIWDARTGSELAKFQGNYIYGESVAFSPDGKHVVSGDGDTVAVWDASDGDRLSVSRLLLRCLGHNGIVTSVVYSPDGKRLVSASRDTTVKVWDITTGEVQLVLEGHSRAVFCSRFSPDGKRIVAASEDNTVSVWDSDTGQEFLTLRGHDADVHSVCFSPDGKKIASGSEDKTVRIWDAASGKETHTLEAHRGAVTSVGFSPDGSRLVSGSVDKTVKVWHISPTSPSK